MATNTAVRQTIEKVDAALIELEDYSMDRIKQFIPGEKVNDEERKATLAAMVKVHDKVLRLVREVAKVAAHEAKVETQRRYGVAVLPLESGDDDGN